MAGELARVHAVKAARSRAAQRAAVTVAERVRGALLSASNKVARLARLQAAATAAAAAAVAEGTSPQQDSGHTTADVSTGAKLYGSSRSL